jgi:hypothetical protein
MAKVTVTPRLILPAPFRWAASLLHHETTAAIRNIVVVATGKDIPRNVPGATTPRINRQAAVASALKMLLDVGIVTPLQAFHACIVDNAQDRCIAKAAVEPQLKQAALRIAAVVDAERPANHGPKFFFFFHLLTRRYLVFALCERFDRELKLRILLLSSTIPDTIQCDLQLRPTVSLGTVRFDPCSTALLFRFSRHFSGIRK